VIGSSLLDRPYPVRGIGKAPKSGNYGSSRRLSGPARDVHLAYSHPAPLESWAANPNTG